MALTSAPDSSYCIAKVFFYQTPVWFRFHPEPCCSETCFTALDLKHKFFSVNTALHPRIGLEDDTAGTGGIVSLWVVLKDSGVQLDDLQITFSQYQWETLLFHDSWIAYGLTTSNMSIVVIKNALIVYPTLSVNKMLFTKLGFDTIYSCNYWLNI